MAILHTSFKVSAVAISAQISSGTASCFMNDIFDEFISRYELIFCCFFVVMYAKAFTGYVALA